MGKPIRIVIADDHALVREGTRQILEDHPGLVVAGEAQDGEEAVAMVSRLQPDVVLMDISMPKMNGIDATRIIKKESPATSVLILTAYDDDQYIFALLDAGAAGYLLKNVRGEELAQAVRAVAEGESVLHPAIAAKVFKRYTRSDQAVDEQIEPLTNRESEVLAIAARGLSNKMIARELSLSDRTVQVHLSNIFGKLGVASRTEAVITALRRGLLKLEELS
ncbi:MAG: response regulator transcription factor [Chloroflexi bacterium]|nr:response regulator transcription factor [Chloroflexota bacterium]MCH8920798.1 response regulator transcription factor [Chloroflexota bacterium]